MKELRALQIFVVLCGLMRAVATSAQQGATATAIDDKSILPVITERGAHHRVWEMYTLSVNPDGSQEIKTNQYTELATGMHYQEAGEWKETKEAIEQAQDGIVALSGPHKVKLAANLNTAGAIDLTTPDGQRLRSTIVGLGYFDMASGKSVLIGETQDSAAELLPPNQVIYRNAFRGIKADVRYTYSRAGFEQDVIVVGELPAPADYGFDPKTTRLEVLTEFLQPPAPVKSDNILPSNLSDDTKATMAQADTIDETLTFGLMTIGPGQAFATQPVSQTAGQVPSVTVPVTVAKEWKQIDGRNILVEAVDYEQFLKTSAKNKTALNRAKRIGDVDSKEYIVAVRPPEYLPAENPKDRSLPPARHTVTQARQLQVATIKSYEPSGMVIDYAILSSSSNFTFQSGSTYLLNGSVTLTGTTVIEGGAVIKFTNASPKISLSINGPIDCQTSPYRPAVFTARDDNTVGEVLPGSSGTPTNYYANYAINAAVSGGGQLHDLQIRWASSGINWGNYPTRFSNIQFVNCGFGMLFSASDPIALHNILMTNIAYMGIFTHNTTVNAQHITVNGMGGDLIDNDSGGAGYYVTLTNSILCNVSGYGDTNYIKANYNATYSAPDLYQNSGYVLGTYPFETLGAGGHYLPTNSSLRNAGTTNIDARMLTDLKSETTQVPIILTNVVSTQTVLSQRPIRDTDVPDLGYHYAAVDYMMGGFAITNAQLTITKGTSVGVFMGAGLWLQDGATLNCVGSPISPVRFCRYYDVQEQPIVWGGSVGSETLVMPYNYGVSPPAAKFRFTEFSVSASGYGVVEIGAPWSFSSLELRDCTFRGGFLKMNDANTTTISYKFINNCFQRVTTSLSRNGILEHRNNLHIGGAMTLLRLGGTNQWTLTDNLFAGCTISKNGTMSYSNNGYINQTNSLTPTNAADVFATNYSFVAGPLGAYYHPTNSSFLNAGSQTAAAAGLYHYTVTTNQTKEGSGTVDIGFHYVAVDAYGFPLDYDGDGLPDYLEDANGNGSQDGIETSYLLADSDGNGISDALEDSDYDGVSNYQEYLEGTDLFSSANNIARRLGYWRFNLASYAGEAGQLPKQATNVQSVVSWSGKAVQVNGISNTVRIAYRDVETNGAPNINCQNGSVRFWFRPSWTSGTNGGAGPGSYARLLEMGRWTGDNSYGSWILSLDPTGDHLSFYGQSGGSFGDYQHRDCSLKSNTWYQITLTYSASGSAIYFNGQPMTSGYGGSGITCLPGAVARAADGFSLGSDFGGSEQALAQFEELETFNYVLSAQDIANNYNAIVNADDDGDGVPNYLDANPANSSIGILRITIESPSNGTVIQ